MAIWSQWTSHERHGHVLRVPNLVDRQSDSWTQLVLSDAFRVERLNSVNCEWPLDDAKLQDEQLPLNPLRSSHLLKLLQLELT